MSPSVLDLKAYLDSCTGDVCRGELRYFRTTVALWTSHLSWKTIDMVTNKTRRRRVCNQVTPPPRDPMGCHHISLSFFSFFVTYLTISDVISFLVQMGGAILLLNKNGDSTRQQTGQNTLMAGLAINLASFCFFFTLIIWYEVATRRIVRSLSGSTKRSYAPIVWAAMVSQIFLIWRSIYRVIEFQQGYFSPIATTEIYFYFFDTLIMLLATAIYVFLFPPAFGLLGKRRLALKLEEESLEMGRRAPRDGHTIAV